MNVETISNYCFEGASLNGQLTLSHAESIGQDALKNTRISGKPQFSSSLFNVTSINGPINIDADESVNYRF